MITHEHLQIFLHTLIGGCIIAGRQDNPTIIRFTDGGLVALNCFVRDNDIILMSAPKNGQEMGRIDITKTSWSTAESVMLQNWAKEPIHRKVYVVGYQKIGLFLSGWNFSDRDNREGRYPVFARHQPQLFWTENYAKQICEDYPLYNMDII